MPDAGSVLHLSEWVGRPQQGGDVVEADGVRVVVRKGRRQKVLEAQVERRPA